MGSLPAVTRIRTVKPLRRIGVIARLVEVMEKPVSKVAIKFRGYGLGTDLVFKYHNAQVYRDALESCDFEVFL